MAKRHIPEHLSTIKSQNVGEGIDVEYSVLVKNKSKTGQKFVVYHKSAQTKDAPILAWLVSPYIDVGSNNTFSWKSSYQFFWNSTGVLYITRSKLSSRMF